MPATIGWTGRDIAKELRTQLVQHHIPRERRRKVLGQAELHELAVEGDLSILTNPRDPNVGWADPRQPFQFGDRIIDPADVRYQRKHVGIGLEHPYGITNGATFDR